MSSRIADPARPKRSFARALPAAGFLLLLVALFADPLLKHRNFIGRDLLGYHLPVEHAIHDAYSRGRLPVWFSDISGGRPLLSNPNVGAFYPLRPVLSLLPFPVAMRIYPVLHLAIGAIGLMLLLQSLGVSAAGCFVGAVTYSLSGVAITEIIFTNIQPSMSLLPWFLWGLRRGRANTAGRILVLSLLFALAYVIGDVFGGVLIVICCSLWIAFEVDGAEQKRSLAALGVAAVLGMLLALPQIVATALWIPFTNRGVLGMKLGEVFLYSISPFRLLELFVPFPFGTTWDMSGTGVFGMPVFHYKQIGFFASLYPGALAVIALVALLKSRARGARFGRILFSVTLALGVPGSLWPAAWNNVASPLPLRYPEKFAVGVVLALAVLAGIAFDAFRRGARPARWTLVAAAALTSVASLAAVFPVSAGAVATALVGADPAFQPAARAHLAPAFAEGGLMWVGTLVALDLARRRGTIPLLVAVLLLTAVPIAANRRIALTDRQEAIFDPPPFDRWVARRDPAGIYRVLGESPFANLSKIELAQLTTDPNGIEIGRRSWDQYTHSLYGRGAVFNLDFDGGDLSRLESLRRTAVLAARYKDSADFFGGLALRWGIRYRDQEALSGYRPVGGDSLQFWDEHERAYPAMRLARAWLETPGGTAALNSLNQTGPGEVLIETGGTGRGRARPGAIRLVENSPERVVLESRSPDPCWLFLLRGYFPFRDVSIDGREAEVLPANLAFSAVAVPAGSHRVEWQERVPGWPLSLWGPVLYIIAAAGIVLAGRARRIPA